MAIYYRDQFGNLLPVVPDREMRVQSYILTPVELQQLYGQPIQAVVSNLGLIVATVGPYDPTTNRIILYNVINVQNSTNYGTLSILPSDLTSIQILGGATPPPVYPSTYPNSYPSSYPVPYPIPIPIPIGGWHHKPPHPEPPKPPHPPHPGPPKPPHPPHPKPPKPPHPPHPEPPKPPLPPHPGPPKPPHPEPPKPPYPESPKPPHSGHGHSASQTHRF